MGAPRARPPLHPGRSAPSADMKDIVNTKIKFREPYRPFAPSVIEERVHEYFDAPGVERQYPARFMLLVVDVKPSSTR